MKDKNPQTDHDLHELAENEAAILREHGGGYAAALTIDLPVIEEAYDAAFMFEAFAAHIEAAEEAGVPWSGIATGLIAAAAAYTTQEEIGRASSALAPFRQAQDLDDPECQCPKCLEEAAK